MSRKHNNVVDIGALAADQVNLYEIKYTIIKYDTNLKLCILRFIF